MTSCRFTVLKLDYRFTLLEFFNRFTVWNFQIESTLNFEANWSQLVSKTSKASKVSIFLRRNSYRKILPNALTEWSFNVCMLNKNFLKRIGHRFPECSLTNKFGSSNELESFHWKFFESSLKAPVTKWRSWGAALVAFEFDLHPSNVIGDPHREFSISLNESFMHTVWNPNFGCVGQLAIVMRGFQLPSCRCSGSFWASGKSSDASSDANGSCHESCHESTRLNS